MLTDEATKTLLNANFVLQGQVYIWMQDHTNSKVT